MSRGLEEIARWMIARGYATGHGDSVEDLLGELEWQAREGKRRSSRRPKRIRDPDCLHCVLLGALQAEAGRRVDRGEAMGVSEVIWALVEVLDDARGAAPDGEKRREMEDEVVDQLTQAGFPVVRAGRA
jgi:hypothetical protein